MPHTAGTSFGQTSITGDKGKPNDRPHPPSLDAVIIAHDGQRNARTALGLWLASFRSETTRHAYGREIEAFTAFTRQEDAAGTVAAFLALDDGAAHAIADAWRTAKLTKEAGGGIVTRSLSASKSVWVALRLARHDSLPSK